MGACLFDGSCASGTAATADAFLGAYCDLPAGLFVSSHSVAVQVLEVVVVPLHRVGGPCALQAAGDRIAAFAAAKAVLPAEALLLQVGALWFGTDVLVLRSSTMCFAERVSAGNERNRLLVIHRHAAERLANILCCSERVRVTVRPLWIHVDQAHVVGAEGSLDFPVTAVALICKPRALRPPVSLVGLPRHPRAHRRNRRS